MSPAGPHRVEGLGQPVQGQVEPAVEADQLGQDAGQDPLGQVEGVAVQGLGRRGRGGGN
jgi:hypothetical protein